MLILTVSGTPFSRAFNAILFCQYQPSSSRPALPDQGWSQEDRLRYYNTSQSSAVMYYYIFLHVDAVDSQELFRADKNVCNYGFTPQSPISFAVRSKSKSS